jgi:hypothetical protein
VADSALDAAADEAAAPATPPDAPVGEEATAESVYKAVDLSAAAVPTGPPIAFKPAPPVSRTDQEIDLTGELSTLGEDGARELGSSGGGSSGLESSGLESSGLGSSELGSSALGTSGGDGSPADDSGSEPPVADGIPDFSAQHMTLARTYLEMGMTEQAEAALRTAAQAPRLRFEAGSLLGRMMRDRGDIPQALEWLERASEALPTSPEEGRALSYDFGVTLDESGETARALGVFLELQSDAGDYRDVPERIDRLARVQSGG